MATHVPTPPLSGSISVEALEAALAEELAEGLAMELAATLALAVARVSFASALLSHPECVLCRWGLTVRLTALVGAPIHFQRLLPDLRQGLRIEGIDLHQFQRLFLFLFGTSPADPNIAHIRRVVLELGGARLIRVELLGHQNVLVALNGSAGLLVRLVDPGAVIKIYRRRREPLGVVGRAQLRLCFHGDPCPSTFLAADPGGGFVELAVLVLLGILADQPHVPRVVLGKKGELWLAELSCGVVPLPDDQGSHAVDDLAQVGDGGDLATRLAPLLVHDGGPLVDELRPRPQG